MHPGNAGSRWIFRSGITALSLPPPRQKTSRSHLAYHREIPAGRQYEKNNDVFPSHNLHILLFRQFPQGGIIMCCRAAHDASHFATPFFHNAPDLLLLFQKEDEGKSMNSLPDTSKRRSSVNHAEAVDTMPPWEQIHSSSLQGTGKPNCRKPRSAEKFRDGSSGKPSLLNLCG